jgi:hypothetical protein
VKVETHKSLLAPAFSILQQLDLFEQATRHNSSTILGKMKDKNLPEKALFIALHLSLGHVKSPLWSARTSQGIVLIEIGSWEYTG